MRFTPSILLVFFGDKVHVIRAEGEDEVKLGLRTGAIHRKIKEYIDMRIKHKAAEHLAERFAEALLSSEAERRRRNARAEYEEKLKKEKEEMEQKEKMKKEEEQRKEEEARRKELEEKRVREEELKRDLERKRLRVAEGLNRMDLSTAKIRDIKEKMEEAGISYIGLTSREELIKRLRENLPQLQQRLGSANQVGLIDKVFIH